MRRILASYILGGKWSIWMGNVSEVTFRRFKWVEEISQSNKSFVKSCSENSNECIFFKVDVQYLKELHKLHNDLGFVSERMEVEKVGKPVNLHGKKNMLMINAALGKCEKT